METKKLTCCDLMVGDWVRFDMSVSHNNPKGDGKWINCIVGGIGGLAFGGITRFIYLYDVKRKSKIGEFDFVRSLHELSPIPLTAEILEKNGFYFGYTSQQEDAASQIGRSCEKAWTYDEGGGSIQVTFPNECDGGLIVLDDQDFDKNLGFVFANQIYVHELQHALRLCGIDKEITL